jgi:hypothetical protein
MATFMAHGVLESGVVGAITGNPTLAVLGFLHGIWPDVMKTVLKEPHPESGFLYWAFWPHLALDKVFHRYEDWWPYYWWLEVLMWIVGIAGIIKLEGYY